MQNAFCGKWIEKDTEIEIAKLNKTYRCTLTRSNIGMLFENSLIVSEFDDNVQVGGIGVYSPIGDGSSNYVLWSSTKISGLLGSGIALKSDGSEDFCGDYSVRYFVGNNEAQLFLVKINQIENRDIYKLSWYMNDRLALHGIGLMFEDSLAFAWGSINCEFDFNIFNFTDNDKQNLIQQTVKWNSEEIYKHSFVKSL